MMRAQTALRDLIPHGLAVPLDRLTPNHDDHGRLIAGRNVGYALHELGGAPAMRTVAALLVHRGHLEEAHVVRACWSSIGD